MSDDQSFYEIQLNTPHLVLAFLGAAVVGVAIFWLGVVIGSGEDEAGGEPGWQAAVPGALAEVPTGEAPLEFYEAVGEPTEQAGLTANPEPAPSESTQPESTRLESAVAVPEFQPSDPVDESRAPVVAESATGLPRADASLASGWIVQVRSTPDKPAADSLQAELADAGFPAFVVSAEIDGATYYRVRVGRYGSKNEALLVKAELETRADIEASWVTQG